MLSDGLATWSRYDTDPFVYAFDARTRKRYRWRVPSVAGRRAGFALATTNSVIVGAAVQEYEEKADPAPKTVRVYVARVR